MSCICSKERFERNTALFAGRFPQFFALLKDEISRLSSQAFSPAPVSAFPAASVPTSAAAHPRAVPATNTAQAASVPQTTSVPAPPSAAAAGETSPFERDLDICPARNGLPTGRYHGRYLHSSYNPLQEAEREIATALAGNTAPGAAPQAPRTQPEALLVFGFGLGYTALAAHTLAEDKTLIIVEPSLRRALSAFCAVDLSPLFAHKNLVLCIGAKTHEVIPLIERAGIAETAMLRNPAREAHAEQFFAELAALIDRNKRKDDINSHTLEKFSKLWFRNMCRNVWKLAECDGIVRFKNRLPPEVPAVVCAAGPTLLECFPILRELQDKALIVCVDTALRALLREGISPHFILLCDPQFYNARHLDGLSAPHSILITESAAYPSVFRFPCRETVLCSSMFPLGQYLEKRIGQKGVLGAGGSVSSSAWDFARFCGAKTIYLAGLDLGYPQKKTHTKGSTFEEKTLASSRRLAPADTALTGTLFGPLAVKKQDYRGRELLSDRRMEMYAWWFESRAAQYPEIVTKSLSDKSLAIPGFSAAGEPDCSYLAALPKKTSFFEELLGPPAARDADAAERKLRLAAALRQLGGELASLKELAQKALAVATTRCHSPQEYQRAMLLLQDFDQAILASGAKSIVALLFPTKTELERLFSAESGGDTKTYQGNLERSAIIYRKILSTAQSWQDALPIQ